MNRMVPGHLMIDCFSFSDRRSILVESSDLEYIILLVVELPDLGTLKDVAASHQRKVFKDLSLVFGCRLLY
jgi:hypothetical protein